MFWKDQPIDPIRIGPHPARSLARWNREKRNADSCMLGLAPTDARITYRVPDRRLFALFIHASVRYGQWDTRYRSYIILAYISSLIFFWLSYKVS
jgi:hypothetical protein